MQDFVVMIMESSLDKCNQGAQKKQLWQHFHTLNWLAFGAGLVQQLRSSLLCRYLSSGCQSVCVAFSDLLKSVPATSLTLDVKAFCLHQDRAIGQQTQGQSTYAF